MNCRRSSDLHVLIQFPFGSISYGNRKWKIKTAATRGCLYVKAVYMVEKSERSNKNCRRSNDNQFSVFATISISCGNRKWKMEIPATRGCPYMDLVYMVEK